MSFVIVAPELVEAAAHDLAGIGSTLGEATGLAAAPTTSIAAAGTDEVSVAIAALFGNHGQEFQALSAQAAAFHEEFVGLMKSGAGAYLSTEVANAEQTLSGALHAPAQALGGGAVTALEHGGSASLLPGRITTGAQAISQSITALQAEVGTLTRGEIPSLINGFNTFGATVAPPYQTLFSNTAANLQTLGSAISANPHPLLHQIISNQAGYAQTIGTGFIHTIENLPGELANLPGHIQTGLRAISSVNPEALAQHFIDNRIGYGQTPSAILRRATLPARWTLSRRDLATCSSRASTRPSARMAF
jgi:PE family